LGEGEPWREALRSGIGASNGRIVKKLEDLVLPEENFLRWTANCSTFRSLPGVWQEFGVFSGRFLVHGKLFLGGNMADTRSRLSRRSLLGMSWRGVVAAGVMQADRLTAWAMPMRRGLESATAESFQPGVGKTFEFLKPAGERGLFASTVSLKLMAVTRHEHLARIEARSPALRGKRKRESFSLLFELQGREPLGPGLHEFARGEFRGCPLFLSRVESSGNNLPIRYEAVFG